jgi:hypothetical protein
LRSIGLSPGLFIKSIYGILPGALEISLLGTILIFSPINQISIFYKYKTFGLFVFRTKIKFIIFEQVINILYFNNLDNKKNISCLLADFIINELGIEKDSRIQVCICDNFIIVKGETSSNDIINLSNTLDSFYKKYTTIKSSKNIIDLIEYNRKLSQNKTMKFSFINDENCGIKPSNDDKEYFSISTFPYGYSFSQDRLLYYYFKKITYSIPSTYPYTKISFNISNENNKIDFTITDDYLNNENDCLKSIILDLYDFDLTSFQNEIKKMDLDVELLNPNDDIEFLKIKNKDFIII